MSTCVWALQLSTANSINNAKCLQKGKQAVQESLFLLFPEYQTICSSPNSFSYKGSYFKSRGVAIIEGFKGIYRT